MSNRYIIALVKKAPQKLARLEMDVDEDRPIIRLEGKCSQWSVVPRVVPLSPFSCKKFGVGLSIPLVGVGNSHEPKGAIGMTP